MKKINTREGKKAYKKILFIIPINFTNFTILNVLKIHGKETRAVILSFIFLFYLIIFIVSILMKGSQK